MNSNADGNTTVYRTDFNGRSYYKITWPQKTQDGHWEYGYIKAQFKKGVEVEDKTRIKIKSAFMKWYKKSGETVPYWMILDFEENRPDVQPEQMDFEAISEDVPF